MNNFIFYDYVYDNDQILSLKNFCLTCKWDSDFGRSTRITRKSRRYYTNPLSEVNLPVLQNYPDPNKLVEKYLHYLPTYPATFLHEGISKSDKFFPDIKFAKYEENDNFDWHCDYWPQNQQDAQVNFISSTSFEETRPIIKRQLSSITYLNDDFDGGETEFSCGAVIKPQIGKTLIFPSTWLFPHRGKLVTKGTKYIYVSHIWA
jgi:hypothetical protein